MSEVLVTGATGFVGSWLTRRLLREGHRVRVLCRSASKLDQDLKRDCEIFIGDITDPKSLITSMTGVSKVYHLAGLVAYTDEMRSQMELVNVKGTENVINACISLQVKELIYMSSVVAIGASHNPEVLNENSPYTISDLNLGYFETKRKAEELIVQANRKNNLKVFILNPSTIYGPGDFKKDSRKIQLKVAQGKFPFYTFGGVSVVSINDIVEAAIRVSQLGRSGERYILSGDNITIKELFELIASEMNVKAPWIPLPTPIVRALGRFGKLSRESSFTSTMYHWFDNKKAQKELGIQFKSSREAIKDSISWLKSHQNEF